MNSKNAEQIEKIIGYTFKDKNVLKTAFTHSSYAKERGIESNERMEFLGDGVLNFVVADMLFCREGIDEGVMSIKRSKIVSRIPLAKEVERLNILPFLMLGQSRPEDNISAKFKSNLFEAVVAAIYLDGGLDLAKDFIRRTLLSHVMRGDIIDYKTKLQELAQQKKRKVEYTDKTISQVPPLFNSQVFIDEKLCGEGSGARKKQAQQEAAKHALEKINLRVKG